MLHLEHTPILKQVANAVPTLRAAAILLVSDIGRLMSIWTPYWLSLDSVSESDFCSLSCFCRCSSRCLRSSS